MKKTIIITGAIALVASSAALASKLNVNTSFKSNPQAVKTAASQAYMDNCGGCSGSCSGNCGGCGGCGGSCGGCGGCGGDSE